MTRYHDVSKYSQSNKVTKYPYNLCLEVISKITIFFSFTCIHVYSCG